MTARSPRTAVNWVLLGGAVLFHLFLSFCFFVGMLLGDCLDADPARLQACFAGKDIGMRILLWGAGGLLVAGLLAEWRWRWAGIGLLFAGPVLRFVAVTAWPL